MYSTISECLAPKTAAAHWNASAAGAKLPSLALVWPIHLCSSRTSSGRSACGQDDEEKVANNTFQVAMHE